MKVVFAQPDFPFADKTLPLVKRVATKLQMTKLLTSIMIDVIDYGAPAARTPSDSIEVYSNGGVRLHLRYSFDRHAGDTRSRLVDRISSAPPRPRPAE